MANSTTFLDNSKTCVNNICVGIAANYRAFTFKFDRSPIVQRTVAIIDILAPYAIAMVGTYYAPARVTLVALGITVVLVRNNVITGKTLTRAVLGVALSILLAKSVLTFTTVALVGVAGCYFTEQEKARHSAARREENEKLQKKFEDVWNNKPKVEDVTDEVSENEVSISEDSSQEALNSFLKQRQTPVDDSFVPERKLPKLHINGSDTEDEVSENEVSNNEDSSVEANTQ